MSIGDTLAEARRQRGLTITQVSQETRIRETLIRGIEQGDFSSCGGDFYARGHIRSIASVVGVDPVPLIREYDEEHGPPGGMRARANRTASAPAYAIADTTGSAWPDGAGGSAVAGTAGPVSSGGAGGGGVADGAGWAPAGKSGGGDEEGEIVGRSGSKGAPAAAARRTVSSAARAARARGQPGSVAGLRTGTGTSRRASLVAQAGPASGIRTARPARVS